MAKYKVDDLISELKADVHKIIASAEQMQEAEQAKLVYQPGKKEWSVVQILEHLNAYNRTYLKQIDKALSERKYNRNAWFSSGILGNYFTKVLKPANVFEVKNKMKTSKKYAYPNNLNVTVVFKEFLQHQEKLIQLLEQSKGSNLNAIKIPLTISRFVKFKLGDVFRFLIAHEQRHMVQARNTIRKVGISTNQYPAIMEFAKLQNAFT